MEPITMFAAFICIMATCRLTFVVAEFFGKGIYSKDSNPAKCDDWYCFFKTSDLLGPEQEHSATITEQGSLEQRRRMQQQRPRLQA